MSSQKQDPKQENLRDTADKINGKLSRLNQKISETQKQELPSLPQFTIKEDTGAKTFREEFSVIEFSDKLILF